MIHIRQIFILFCVALTAVACVDVIPVTDDEVKPKLILESDINSTFRMYVSTSANLADVTTISYPKDADIFITTTDDTDISYTLVYKEECKCYEPANSDDKPKKKTGYVVTAYIEDKIEYIDTAVGYMFVPNTAVFDEAEVHTMDDVHEMKSVKAKIRIDKRNPGSDFYKVKPYRYELEKYVDSTDEIQYKRTGKVSYLDLHQSHAPSDVYLEQLYDEAGFFVDASNIDSNIKELEFDLVLPEEFDSESDKFTKLYFELTTMEESMYRYQLYKNREKSALDGHVEPVISYTNVINGYGFFGSYTTHIDSFVVQ